MNVVRYAGWMQNRGWHVVLFGVKDSRIYEEAKKQRLDFIEIKANRKHFDFSNAIKIGKLFKKNNINLVWYRDNRDLSVLAWAKFFGFRFSLMYQQAMQFGSSKRDIVHTLRYRYIDLWVSALGFLANQVKEMTSFPKDRIVRIPLGSEPKKLSEGFTDSQCRSSFNLPERAIVLGILGRLDPLKGQHLLIKAASVLKDEFPELHILIVGESTLHEGEDYSNSLRQQVKQSGLEHRVHFFGYTDRTEVFYHAIDLFVMASKGETFGMVTIESMSAGKPVLGTNSSGTPEILNFGEAGWLFEPENSESLIRNLRHILKHPESIKQKGASALEIYNSKFSKDASLQLLEEAINRL
ncbi:MAG: glycosyltransferase family 4 protein [Flavobacteriales bacterium]|nr:glycosyltransferase family 4 protein [Flavobacteriales bacterium]